MFNRFQIKRLYYFEAVYTVELSILFPIIIFAVLAGIYFGFYVHDMAVARAVVNQFCIESVGQDISEKELIYDIKLEMESKMILGQIHSIDAYNTKKENGIIVKINYKILFWNINKSETIQSVQNKTNISDYIRKVKVVADEIEGVIQ